MDTTVMMAMLAALVCLSLLGGGAYYYMTSSGDSSSGGSSSGGSSSGSSSESSGGGSSPASSPSPAAGSIPVLRAGQFNDKTFLFLRGESNSPTPFVTQQSPSRVQLSQATCASGQVGIQNLDTRRWLVPNADRSLAWSSQVSTPFGCWAKTTDPACPGESAVYESVRFPAYRLRRGQVPHNGGNVAVALGSPGEYDTARTRDFKGFCWKEDTIGDTTA